MASEETQNANPLLDVSLDTFIGLNLNEIISF